MLQIPDCGIRLLRYTTRPGPKANEGETDTHFQQLKACKLIPGVTSFNKHTRNRASRGAA